MRVVVITPPAPVVTWEEADAQMNLGGDTSQKLFVEALVAGATNHIDGPDGWLGRAIGAQTLEARFAAVGSHSVRLPYSPVASLVSVKYLDPAGTEQAANLSDFNLYGDDLEPASTDWPWNRASTDREAVRVRYVAGSVTPPAAIRIAILMMVADLYRFRETVAAGQMTKVEMSATVESLLEPFRVFR